MIFLSINSGIFWVHPCMYSKNYLVLRLLYYQKIKLRLKVSKIEYKTDEIQMQHLLNITCTVFSSISTEVITFWVSGRIPICHNTVEDHQTFKCKTEPKQTWTLKNFLNAKYSIGYDPFIKQTSLWLPFLPERARGTQVGMSHLSSSVLKPIFSGHHHLCVTMHLKWGNLTITCDGTLSYKQKTEGVLSH